MRDLEIRGAGNLLGDEQSGQVAAIGFEMYAQLLDEAVSELRGEEPSVLPPVRVEIPVTAYVPPQYIAYEATKIDAHRRIAQAHDPHALDEVRGELTDRFGAPPEPVENLLWLQDVRLKAAALRAAAIVFRGERLTVDGLRLDDEWAARLRAAAPDFAYFKQKASLVAHRRDGGPGEGGAGSVGESPGDAGEGPAAVDAAAEAAPAHERNSPSHLLTWVGSVLDAIIQARTADPQAPERGTP